ncbi:hypothetical protein [Marinicella rhabdoformis]|uniref:hypothetical protein n=1 Tax=Marinicella rhabdoformis TaxID=2580566 RepID=UPI0012AEDF1A|nr:hypothetical protein [Marinicella rhabdoformis]
MKKLSLLVIIVIAVLLWFWTAKEQKEFKTTPNLVSKTDGINLNNQVKQTENERVKPKAQHSVESFEISERQPDAVETQKALSYLQVYQQLQLAKSCQSIFSELMTDENIDFDRWLTETMRNVSQDELYQPSRVQFDLLHQQIVECSDLKEHVMGLSNQVFIKDQESNSFNQHILVEELAEQLSLTKPESEKEQALSRALDLIETWKDLLSQVAFISKGDDTLTAEAVLELVNQLKALNKSRYEPTALNNSKLQMEITLQIEAIQAQLSAQKRVDETLRNQVMVALHEKTDELFNMLYSNGPEVFAEVNQALNLASKQLMFTYVGKKQIKNMSVDELVPEYVFPMEITQTLIGGIDTEWLAINGDHIDRMIYCNLGGDCLADSLLIRNLCLPFYGVRTEPAACGLSVENFMRTRWLGQHQLQDIRYVVDWLEAQYGS